MCATQRWTCANCYFASSLSKLLYFKVIKKEGEKRLSLLFEALFKIQLIMLPEKCGKCSQIVLNLLDCWVNATRNDLLFIVLFCFFQMNI